MAASAAVRIPLAKPLIGEREKAAVLAVLDSGMLAEGERVAQLEMAFQRLVGVSHAIAVSSGTAALHLALLAHGIGPGDEVITSPFTFAASANAILLAGARPVFADVDPLTFNVDSPAIVAAITPSTRAIMPVHLYGQPCQMDAIMDLAQCRGLAVIEDAAQAVGATFQGRHVGSFGTGCFSLYATKNVTSAEGGMITTNDPGVADRARLLRNHGMARRYHHELLGFNYRMSDVHAAIGLTQLERLAEITSRRQANAAFLNQRLRSVITPSIAEGREHCWHQYTIRLDGGRDRESAIAALAEAGIGTGVYYPIPVHRQAYMVEAAGNFSLPAAEQAAREVLSLPVHPGLSANDLETIALEVNKL